MPAATSLAQLLKLRVQPVAVKFQDSAPPGIPRIDRAAPSGCTYWKYAAEGRSFYTEAADHYNCPIGAYTHGIDAPDHVKKELEGVVTTMISLGYLRGEEVPGIPRREAPFKVAVYAPLTETNGDADVVII